MSNFSLLYIVLSAFLVFVGVAVHATQGNAASADAIRQAAGNAD